MTGFGLGDAPLGGGRVMAEIRSVNQRFLDVRAKLPRELVDLTMFAEQVTRERLRRGRVELHVRLDGAGIGAGALDRERARAAYQALSELRDELAPGAEVPLSLLAAVPDLFTPAGGPELAAARDATRAAIERAIQEMDAMCRREGEAIAADMRQRIASLRALAEQIEARTEAARDELRRRMQERVARLIQDAGAAVDPERVEAEVVLLAERSDVTEEIIRLKSHLDQYEGVLSADGGEPCGRRLDFLLQEMLREANTLGAKAQDAIISQQVVGMKVELERLREQAQNVE
ncbi:MAG TPA: YicC/YloC family endoribonuclease [Candidatus Nanopelagicales bacterium]|nr:YicC/YloC family endoribonuclease [Candidatus Nanopelagicales bacterium]